MNPSVSDLSRWASERDGLVTLPASAFHEALWLLSFMEANEGAFGVRAASERAMQSVEWPEVHGPTRIRGWTGWPEDVRATLIRRNSRHHRLASGEAVLLSFVRSERVFKCHDCRRFWRPAEHGDACPWGYEGPRVCDECLIARAREDRWER